MASRTLSGQVLDAVRNQIVSGQLKSDQPLRQDSLAAELGVSKIPLREALGRLEMEGLLRSYPNRGYSVEPRSRRQLQEIFDLRLAIEPMAASRAAIDATEGERLFVHRAHAELERACVLAADDVVQLHRKFHVAICYHPHNELTNRQVEWLAILTERYVIAQGQNGYPNLNLGSDQVPYYMADHHEMLGAYMRREGDQLKRLLLADLEAKYTMLESLYSD